MRNYPNAEEMENSTLNTDPLLIEGAITSLMLKRYTDGSVSLFIDIGEGLQMVGIGNAIKLGPDDEDKRIEVNQVMSEDQIEKVERSAKQSLDAFEARFKDEH